RYHEILRSQTTRGVSSLQSPNETTRLPAGNREIRTALNSMDVGGNRQAPGYPGQANQASVDRQIQLPGLFDQVLAERGVLALLGEAKAERLVNVARSIENAVGPQHHPAIALRAREADAFADELLAEPHAARRRLDQQHAQLRGIRIFFDDEYAS